MTYEQIIGNIKIIDESIKDNNIVLNTCMRADIIFKIQRKDLEKKLRLIKINKLKNK